MNFNFNQALADKGRRADEGMRQEWQKINDNYEIGKLNALNGGGGGSAVKPALGLAAAKTPTFSNMITPTTYGPTKGTVSADNWGKLPNSSVFDDPVVRQGMRRGNTYVKDKTGRGNPKKDTVPAELAEGEAVLNAAAAEMLGRDKIERLNAEGAAAMGLRGGAKMKDGVMHAYVGEEFVGKVKNAWENMGNNRGLPRNPSVSVYSVNGSPVKPTFNPPELPKSGAGGLARSAGTGASIFGYMAMPDEMKVPAMPSFGPLGAMKTALTAGQNAIANSETATRIKEGAQKIGDGMMEGLVPGFGSARKSLSAAKQMQPVTPSVQTSPMLKPTLADTKNSEAIKARWSNVDPNQLAQMETERADEAEFSKFFNENGITDDMRANPAQAGLRAVKNPYGDKVYGQGPRGESRAVYTGVGAPSRLAAEKAKAEDPALKRAAVMEQLREDGRRGNENSTKMYEAMVQEDSYANTARQGVEQERLKAGAGGKDGKEEFKILKDAADRMRFYTPDGAPDHQAQSEFNSFWAKDISRLKQQAAADGEEINVNDPAAAHGFMQEAQARFEMMRRANKKAPSGASLFDVAPAAARRVPDLTLANARGVFSGQGGKHSMWDALYDDLPFTDKGGTEFTSGSFGENDVNMLVPSHRDKFSDLSSSQMQAYQEFLRQGGK